MAFDPNNPQAYLAGKKKEFDASAAQEYLARKKAEATTAVKEDTSAVEKTVDDAKNYVGKQVDSGVSKLAESAQDAGRGTLHGATGGWRDEIGGVMSGMIESSADDVAKVKEAIRTKDWSKLPWNPIERLKKFGEGYKTGVTAERFEDAKSKKRSPIIYGGTSALGAIPLALATGGAGLAGGAVLGGASALGNSEGGGVDQGLNTATGVGLGAAQSIPYVGPFVGPAAGLYGAYQARDNPADLTEALVNTGVGAASAIRGGMLKGQRNAAQSEVETNVTKAQEGAKTEFDKLFNKREGVDAKQKADLRKGRRQEYEKQGEDTGAIDEFHKRVGLKEKAVKQQQSSMSKAEKDIADAEASLSDLDKSAAATKRKNKQTIAQRAQALERIRAGRVAAGEDVAPLDDNSRAIVKKTEDSLIDNTPETFQRLTDEAVDADFAGKRAQAQSALEQRKSWLEKLKAGGASDEEAFAGVAAKEAKAQGRSSLPPEQLKSIASELGVNLDANNAPVAGNPKLTPEMFQSIRKRAYQKLAPTVTKNRTTKNDLDLRIASTLRDSTPEAILARGENELGPAPKEGSLLMKAGKAMIPGGGRVRTLISAVGEAFKGDPQYRTPEGKAAFYNRIVQKIGSRPEVYGNLSRGVNAVLAGKTASQGLAILLQLAEKNPKLDEAVRGELNK